MNIYDLNPGDIIRIKPAEYRVNIFKRDITEEEQTNYVKRVEDVINGAEKN